MEDGQNHEQNHPNSSDSPGFFSQFSLQLPRHAPTKTQAPGAGGAPGILATLATASEDTSLRVLNVSGRIWPWVQLVNHLEKKPGIIVV